MQSLVITTCFHAGYATLSVSAWSASLIFFSNIMDVFAFKVGGNIMSDALKENITSEDAHLISSLDMLMHKLRRVQQRASSIFAEYIGDGQMTPAQWAVLSMLKMKGALSQNQLGRFTNMDPATTQGVVLRLADRKLVERRPDPADRRRTNVSLTNSGHALVSSLEPNAYNINERVLERLSQAERRTLVLLLDKLM